MQTLQEVRLHTRNQLFKARVDAPALCADLILCHALQCDRVKLLIRPDYLLTPTELHTVNALLQRRLTGEPLAYITGTREFFSRDFAVTPATLIPRPETELLVECALEHLPSTSKRLHMLDAGTGSGCIAITMLAESPQLMGIALDSSKQALQVARHNAQTHGVDHRLQCLLGDFTTPLLQASSIDVYLSNPPYISQAEYRELSPEVRNFEPATALVPGYSGLEHAEPIIAHASTCIRPHGIFLMEFGCSQGQSIAELFEPFRAYWKEVIIHQDLAGLDRFVFAKRSTAT